MTVSTLRPTSLLTTIHSREVVGAMSMGPGLLVFSVYTVGAVRTKSLLLGIVYRTIVASLPWPPACRQCGGQGAGSPC